MKTTNVSSSKLTEALLAKVKIAKTEDISCSEPVTGKASLSSNYPKGGDAGHGCHSNFGISMDTFDFDITIKDSQGRVHYIECAQSIMISAAGDSETRFFGTAFGWLAREFEAYAKKAKKLTSKIHGINREFHDIDRDLDGAA